MRNFLPLLVAALISVFLLSACKKSTTTPATASANMSYQVDGTKNTTTQVACYIDTLTVNGSLVHNFYINSQAVQGTFPELTVEVSNPAVGTYIIGAYGTTASVLYVAAAGTGSFNSVSGQLVITAVSSTSISGTFQASCTNATVTPATTHNITQGTFIAPIAQ